MTADDRHRWLTGSDAPGDLARRRRADTTPGPPGDLARVAALPAREPAACPECGRLRREIAMLGRQLTRERDERRALIDRLRQAIGRLEGAP